MRIAHIVFIVMVLLITSVLVTSLHGEDIPTPTLTTIPLKADRIEFAPNLRSE